jgi:hypothetical protein
MNKSLTLAMAAFSFATIGLQADHNEHRFGIALGQNLTFEPIQAASTKVELTEFLKLVDTRKYENKHFRPGDVIGTIGEPQYRIIKVSESESRHINTTLKKIKIPVCADMKIKKGDKVDSHDRYKWYSVSSVRRSKSGYKDLVLVEGTNYE